MASNSFGNVFRITTWGESHGIAIGVVIGLLWWSVSSLYMAEIPQTKALLQLWQLEALRM